MSYPRNAASPPRIAIGPVVQITDGAVQTSGVSVCVRAEGGAETAGGGTVSYGTLSGIVYYTPTQGETDYTAFVLVAYKSGCIPAQVTVATSASATAGYSGVDWSKVTAATSTVNLSGTTISTSQAVASVSGSVGSVTGAVGSVTGAVGSVTSAVTVGTNNDKTGYSLTAGTGLGNQTSNITGNLSGSVGSVTGSVGSIAGVTFPTNFGAILINSSGHLSRVTLVDTTTTNTDMRGTDGAALASAWTATRAGYLDSVLLAQNSNQRTVQVTGSNHVASDVHAFQTDVIDSAAIAASAVTEIQNGLATLSNQTAIKTTTDRLATMLVADGAVYQYTANALELAPGGGGGSGDASQTTLLEVQGTVEAIAASLSGTSVTVTSQISQGGEITLYCGDDYRVRSSTQLDVTITDVGGAIYSRLNGIGVANLSFGAARPAQSAGAISGTVASLSQAGTGSSQTITITVEIEDGGAALRPADDYVWQIVSSEQHGSEYDTQTEIEGTLVLRRRTAVPVYA